MERFFSLFSFQGLLFSPRNFGFCAVCGCVGPNLLERATSSGPASDVPGEGDLAVRTGTAVPEGVCALPERRRSGRAHWRGRSGGTLRSVGGSQCTHPRPNMARSAHSRRRRKTECTNPRPNMARSAHGRDPVHGLIGTARPRPQLILGSASVSGRLRCPADLRRAQRVPLLRNRKRGGAVNGPYRRLRKSGGLKSGLRSVQKKEFGKNS